MSLYFKKKKLFKPFNFGLIYLQIKMRIIILIIFSLLVPFQIGGYSFNLNIWSYNDNNESTNAERSLISNGKSNY